LITENDNEKSPLLFIIISLLFISPAIIDLDDNLSGQNGCCKERDSLDCNVSYESGHQEYVTLNTDAPPPKFRLAALNLFLLITIGVAGSGWTLFYTDYFPVIGGLLGLGGVFAWIAFISNLVSDRRKVQFQETFDSKVLQNFWFSLAAVIILFVGLFLIAPKFGTLLIDSLDENSAHVVEIREVNTDEEINRVPLRRIALPPHSEMKVILSTNWFASRKFRIKVSGLPAKNLSITGWKRKKAIVPDTFQEHAVILARPSASIVSSVANQDFKLEVRLNNKLLRKFNEYNGEALWIGTQDDVKIPQETLERWRFEFIAQGLSSMEINRWLRPLAVAPNRDLPPGAELIVEILRKRDESVAYSARVLISKSGIARHFPEEVVIDGQ
jgi:hypothetical protein